MKCPVIDFESRRKKTYWNLVYIICEHMNCTPEDLRFLKIIPYPGQPDKALVYFTCQGHEERLILSMYFHQSAQRK